jgi:hypothetical protein
MINLRKKCWLTVKISERVAEIVKIASSALGISVSEFTRQALLEKLERMNIVSSEVKTILSQKAGNEQNQKLGGIMHE